MKDAALRSNVASSKTHRQYDSQQGRFTQVDPAGMRATSLGSPQTLNLYAYCANDPINRIDQDGLGILSFIAKIYRAVKKVLKWVAIAVAVFFVVALMFAVLNLPGAQFLADVFWKGLGLLLKFMAHAGIMHFAEAGGLSIGLTGQILAGAMTVGAIANHLTQGPPKKKDQDKRPPKERALIIERPKTPRDMKKEEEYNNCVAHETVVFNQDVVKITEAADKHFEEREGPWWVGLIETIVKNLPGGEERKHPGDPGDTRTDELSQMARTKEIEDGTKIAANARDQRIKNNCKKP